MVFKSLSAPLSLHSLPHVCMRCAVLNHNKPVIVGDLSLRRFVYAILWIAVYKRRCPGACWKVYDDDAISFHVNFKRCCTMYVLWVNWSSRCFDCLYASAMEIRRLNFELYSSISAVWQRAKDGVWSDLTSTTPTHSQRTRSTSNIEVEPSVLIKQRYTLPSLPIWGPTHLFLHVAKGQILYSSTRQRKREIFFLANWKKICLCSNWLIFFGATLGFAAENECILFHLAHSALPLWYCEKRNKHTNPRECNKSIFLLLLFQSLSDDSISHNLPSILSSALIRYIWSKYWKQKLKCNRTKRRDMDRYVKEIDQLGNHLKGGKY